jgi:hypothetical protein
MVMDFTPEDMEAVQACQADGEDVKQSSHLLDINLRHFLMTLPIREASQCLRASGST